VETKKRFISSLLKIRLIVIAKIYSLSKFPLYKKSYLQNLDMRVIKKNNKMFNFFGTISKLLEILIPLKAIHITIILIII
jgi:hypothetical protein